jgi:hypothetical protein
MPGLTVFMEWRALRTGDPGLVHWPRWNLCASRPGTTTHRLAAPAPRLRVEGFAFFVEAIFLGVYLYAWDRLPLRVHVLTGIPVVIAGVASAFFVVTANAWMNQPRGFDLTEGEVTGVQPWEAMFNPATPPQTVHMIVAAFMVTGFGIAAVYAVALLRGKRDRHHRLGFLIPFSTAAVLAPVQVVVGDWAAHSWPSTNRSNSPRSKGSGTPRPASHSLSAASVLPRHHPRRLSRPVRRTHRRRTAPGHRQRRAGRPVARAAHRPAVPARPDHRRARGHRRAVGMGHRAVPGHAARPHRRRSRHRPQRPAPPAVGPRHLRGPAHPFPAVSVLDIPRRTNHDFAQMSGICSLASYRRRLRCRVRRITPRRRGLCASGCPPCSDANCSTAASARSAAASARSAYSRACNFHFFTFAASATDATSAPSSTYPGSLDRMSQLVPRPAEVQTAAHS